MTRHEDIAALDATAVTLAPKTGVEAQRAEMEALHRQSRNEAVAALKADPMYTMGAKITAYGLALASGTVILTAIVVGLMG